MACRWLVASWQGSQDKAQRCVIYNTLIFSSPPRKVGLEATDSNKVRRAGTGVFQTDCKGSHRVGTH
jgi:hypothetical protein